MAKPNKTLLTEEGVLTTAALLAYTQGKLSATEVAEVDKMLTTDPFLQDAIDGIQQAHATQVNVTEAVITLRQNLRLHTGAKERKKGGIEIHWANYAYAAVIFGVLIGVGFVMVHVIGSQKEELAINTPPQAQESTPIIEEKKPEPPKPDTTHIAGNRVADSNSHIADKVIAINTQTAPATTSGAGIIETTQTKTAMDASNAATHDNQAAAVPTKATKEEATGVSMPAPKDSKKDYQIIKNDESSVKPAAKLKANGPVSTETISNNLMVAKTLFDAGDYRAAEKKYNEALGEDPTNPEAMYFGAISNYINGNNKQAEPKFDRLLQKGFFPEGSKWYKANILIKKGQIEDAKPLLRDLINTNNSFKERAVKKYEELIK